MSRDGGCFQGGLGSVHVLHGGTSVSALPQQCQEWNIEFATYIRFFMQQLITSDLGGKQIRTSATAEEIG